MGQRTIKKRAAVPQFGLVHKDHLGNTCRKWCTSRDCICGVGIMTRLCVKLQRDIPMMSFRGIADFFKIDPTEDSIWHFLAEHCQSRDMLKVLNGEQVLGPQPFVLEVPGTPDITLMCFDASRVCAETVVQ